MRAVAYPLARRDVKCLYEKSHDLYHIARSGATDPQEGLRIAQLKLLILPYSLVALTLSRSRSSGERGYKKPISFAIEPHTEYM
jgi:hypothetical protein